MSKYYFKENFHFLYADGQLYDERENIVYDYQNETLMFPKISLYRHGQYLGHVQKNVSFMLSSFDIYVDGILVDTLQQNFALFRNSLYLKQRNWRVEGSFASLHFQIFNDHDELVAEIDKELFRMTQRYFIEIYDEPREIFIILMILAVNQLVKDNDSAAASVSINV